MDDTIVKIHEYDVDGFTAHINSIDRNIQFTTEPELNNKLPFLDLCIHVKEEGGAKITIYRKPMHTDQYINFSSNHPLSTNAQWSEHQHTEQNILSPLPKIKNVGSNMCIMPFA